MAEREQRKVLFLCTGNSARSILAEYLLRAMDPRFETSSAGAEPTGRVHPMALKVLRDAYGIDASAARSKPFDPAGEVDVLITVCDHARDTCPLVPGSPAIQAHWGSPDPACARDSDGEVEAAFLRVARQIHRRLERFCALPFDRLDRGELSERLRRIGDES